MSKRRAKRRGGTLSVSIIVIAFLVVMVVQVVQLKQKESTYAAQKAELEKQYTKESERADAVSYTHLRAHETGRNLVCRLLLEKKKKKKRKKARRPSS